MRRWRGNERLSPEGGKTLLRACERACRISGHAKRGASPAPTSKHPERRVALPSGRASTREMEARHIEVAREMEAHNIEVAREEEED